MHFILQYIALYVIMKNDIAFRWGITAEHCILKAEELYLLCAAIL